MYSVEQELTALFFSIVLFLLLAPVHELIHYLFWRLFGYRPRFILSREVIGIGVAVCADEIRNSSHVVVVALAPQVITVVMVALMLHYYFVGNWFLTTVLKYTIISYISGSLFDFITAYKVAKERNTS